MTLYGHRLLTTAAMAVLFYASTAHASDPAVQPADDTGVFSLVVENDLFGGTDSDYTNGVRFGWLSSESGVPEWVNSASNWVLPEGAESARKRVSLSVGQSMFTPSDITISGRQPGERPYAGWLYGSAGVVADTGKTLDNVMLTVGVIGPASYAFQTQQAVHHLIDSPIPNGWDHQLQNEVGVQATYERKWRNLYQISPFGLGADVTPSAGFNLGNVYTDASVGATFRLGYDLPADYGPPRIRPSLPGSDFFIPTKELGGYLFAGFDGRAVARNIFLDGNTFRNSLSVDKEPFVGSLQAGAAMTYGKARLSYTHVFMTREYEGQKNVPATFGVVTLSYRY